MADGPDRDSMLFWDGKTYPATEMQRVMPGLAATVRANSVLAEQWPMWRLKYANGVFAVAGGLALVLCVPPVAVWCVAAVCYGASGMGLGPLTIAFPLGSLIVALGAFQWLLAFLHYSGYRPIVTVKEGVLSVQTGDAQIRLSADLADCCWYRGWVSDTVVTPHNVGLVLRQRAIVIRCPKQSRFDWRRHVAVGLTDEYHALWEATLKLAEVPQITDKWSEPTMANDARKD